MLRVPDRQAAAAVLGGGGGGGGVGVLDRGRPAPEVEPAVQWKTPVGGRKVETATAALRLQVVVEVTPGAPVAVAVAVVVLMRNFGV